LKGVIFTKNVSQYMRTSSSMLKHSREFSTGSIGVGIRVVGRVEEKPVDDISDHVECFAIAFVVEASLAQATFPVTVQEV